VFPAVVGLLLTVGRRLTSYYGFELSDTPSGLQVRRGLTALSTQVINPARVQGLLVVEPWLWRPFGWARLEVSVAGYRGGDADRVQASSTLLPVAPRAEVLDVVQQVLGHRDVAGVPLLGPPARARWRAPLTARTMAFGQDSRLVVSRRGIATRRLDIVPQERVQSVRLVQGPLDRLFRMVRVHVDSPPGPVDVVGSLRDVDEGRALVRASVDLSRAARAVRGDARVPVEDGQEPANGSPTPPAADTTQ
jgi:putative membrane protein